MNGQFADQQPPLRRCATPPPQGGRESEGALTAQGGRESEGALTARWAGDVRRPERVSGRGFPMTAFAALFLDQGDVADDHAFVGGFEHVVGPGLRRDDGVEREARQAPIRC